MSDYSKYFTGDKYEGGLGINATEESLMGFLGTQMLEGRYADYYDSYNPNMFGESLTGDMLLSGGQTRDEISEIFSDYGYAGGSHLLGSVVGSSMDAFKRETGIDIAKSSSGNFSDSDSQQYLTWLKDWVEEAGLPDSYYDYLYRAATLYGLEPREVYDQRFNTDTMSWSDDGTTWYKYMDAYKELGTPEYGLFAASQQSGIDFDKGPDYDPKLFTTFADYKRDVFNRGATIDTLGSKYESSLQNLSDLGTEYGKSMGQQNIQFGRRGLSGSGIDTSSRAEMRDFYSTGYKKGESIAGEDFRAIGRELEGYATTDQTFTDSYLESIFGEGSAYDTYITRLDEYASDA